MRVLGHMIDWQELRGSPNNDLDKPCHANFVSTVRIPKHSWCSKFARLLKWLSCILVAILQLTALAVFPVGFDAQEVRALCGDDSSVYSLGDCSIGWSYLTMGVCALISCILPVLSHYIHRVPPSPYHTIQQTQFWSYFEPVTSKWCFFIRFFLDTFFILHDLPYTYKN